MEGGLRPATSTAQGPAHRSDPDAPAAPRPPFAASVPATALGVICSAGIAMAIAGASGLIGQTRTLEIAVFATGFGVLLPLAAMIALRLAAAARPGDDLGTPALWAAGGAVALLCAMRVADGLGVPGAAISGLAIAGGIGVAAAALALPGDRNRASMAARRSDGAAGDATGSRAAGRAALAALLAVLALLVFMPAEVSPLAAAAAGLLGAGFAIAALRLRPRARSRPILTTLADLAVLALVALVVVDVTGYWGADFAVSSSSVLPADRIGPIAQIHQHFYLGPVGDVLQGRALLVDADAVYGIGNSYLLAGWFQLAPFGYGSFGLLGSIATAAMLILGWAIVRAAGATRVIAGAAVLAAVMLTVLAPFASPSLFLNVGGLRFAPPYVLLAVALLVCGRDGPVARSPWVLATFAFFSLWSIEAIAYCGATYLALALVDAIPLRSPRRIGIDVIRSLAYLLGASVAAHLLFALATRVLGGDWPDWIGYLAMFDAWSSILANVFGGQVQPWSRAWVLGGLYIGSGVGALLLILRGTTGMRQRRMVLAIAGTSAIGASFLSYFVAHSSDRFLPFVAYPALLVGALWLSIAIRADGIGSPWRRATVGVAAFIAALVVAGSWDQSAERLPRTALAHLVPGGPSLREDARRMWNSPPVDPRAPAAVQLIERFFPSDRALVLTEPDLGQEALIRSGRANLLPISYPWQDEVVPERSVPPVIDAVADLEPGTMALLQMPPDPAAQPSPTLQFEQIFGNVPREQRLGPLARAALDEIRRRFRLVTIARGPDGLYVARLHPRAVSEQAGDG